VINRYIKFEQSYISEIPCVLGTCRSYGNVKELDGVIVVADDDSGLKCALVGARKAKGGGENDRVIDGAVIEVLGELPDKFGNRRRAGAACSPAAGGGRR
jgi:hypothetical protein